jgi:hypothetical protein
MTTTGPLSPIVVTLRGRDRPLRFTVQAIEEFERETHLSIIQAFRDPLALKITDLVTALHIAIKHGGGEANYGRDKIRDWLEQALEAGTLDLATVVERVSEAVQRSATYKAILSRQAPDDDEPAEGERGSASVDGAPVLNPPSTN